MLLDPQLFALYLGAVAALLLAPGPETFLILSRSAQAGRGAGLAVSLGIAVGDLGQTLLASLGVSALIVASPTLFSALRLAGAAYLVFLGATVLLGARRRAYPPAIEAALAMREPTERSAARLQSFVQGCFATLLNPKAVLFYLAFVPQFIDPALGRVGLQALLLGLTLTALALLYHAALATLVARIGRRWLAAPRVRAVLDGAAGLVFLGFALHLLTSAAPA